MLELESKFGFAISWFIHVKSTATYSFLQHFWTSVDCLSIKLLWIILECEAKKNGHKRHENNKIIKCPIRIWNTASCMLPVSLGTTPFLNWSWFIGCEWLMIKKDELIILVFFLNWWKNPDRSWIWICMLQHYFSWWIFCPLMSFVCFSRFSTWTEEGSLSLFMPVMFLSPSRKWLWTCQVKLQNF